MWRAFYRWVITSTDEEFIQELDEWCVRSVVEFFYAFTHIYTMMDNRAKNTFWHFAKTGTRRAVSKPVKELLHVYEELSSDGTYATTKDTQIVAGKTYYTQYAFDLWDYDNDTALGINNNGELIFPYGKEDGDYNIEGNPASGYVFNGATSVFWCRLRDLLASEITSVFSSVASECFSANDLITQFDSYQECYPEEIWRLDIQRKYIRTFTGESIDNSKPKHDVQYLRDMMQGRKKYQRRQWVRDQEIYFGTKTLMNTVVGDNNRITFRCYTPTGNVAVPPNYTLRIIPFQDMYVSVMFGNGGTQQVRAKAGQEYTIECPLSAMDDTQVTIYGANRIAALNDLSACYIAANNFSMATKLRKLVLGNTTEGYSNFRLTSLTLGSNELLEELDIRNCANLTGSLNLAQCSNLLKLYAEGTKLTGVIFATNGKVQLAHLPETINTLTMRNLNDLTDFNCTLSALESLNLEGGTLDSLDVVTRTIGTLQVLYLYDIAWTVGDTTLLNRMAKLFFSLVTGTCYVSGGIRQQEIATYKKAWSDLEVTYDTANLVTQYLVIYVNYNGETLYQEYVDRGSKSIDPVAEGLIDPPKHESDEQYHYTYSGWDNVGGMILSDITITAQYTTSIRTYTVTWYSRPGVSLGSKALEYGEEAVFDGTMPTNTSEESTYVYNIFTGWDKSTGCVKSDLDVYAVWERASLPAQGKDLSEMSCAEVYGICTARLAENYFELKDHIDITLGQDFDFSNVKQQVLAEEKYFDGKTYQDLDIKLFDEDAPSFTLAIDYEFTAETSGATLVSAFVEDGSEGFRLRYNGNPFLQWGDKAIQVGYGGNRNILVLRHKKGSNSVFVYGIDTQDKVYQPTLTLLESVRTRKTNTNQILTFGAVRFLEDGGHDYYATGWLHWCKIWYDDLGATVAQKLASWPRETLRVNFSGSNRFRLASGTSERANASFFAAQPLLRQYTAISTVASSNSGGWEKSKLRKFVNERVYAGFPYKWQAIIKQVKIPATEGGGSSSVQNSSDYVYVPSAVEFGNTWGEPYASEGSSVNYWSSDTARSMFAGIMIPDDGKTITNESDPTILSIYTAKEGDIWIKSNDQSNRYCYISPDTVKKRLKVGSLDIKNSSNIAASDGGYWIKMQPLWTRSAYAGNSVSQIVVWSSGNPYMYAGIGSNYMIVIGISI